MARLPASSCWVPLAACLAWCAGAICPGAYMGTPPAGHAKVPEVLAASAALENVNFSAVVRDIEDLLTDSQDCWPADGGHYGGLFIRAAWHCAGTYRAFDGRGGCAGGRQRFDPEASWADNTNLDKARALLAPVKQKYGDGLSWGDLLVTAGSTAIWSMGGPVSELCFGRADDPDGAASLVFGPSPEQQSTAPCEVDGACKPPLGSSTIGLIYVNPQGPMGVPDPGASAKDIRQVFARMGFNDSETVALIGGGHAFGKAHGACPKGPGKAPKDAPLAPWVGECGTGKGEDTFTSGFEGPWTTQPAKWDNEFFQMLIKCPWEKRVGPGGNTQWFMPNATPGTEHLMRLTTDVALIHDKSYLALVQKFAADQAALDVAFSNAWLTLTTNGGGWMKNRKCFPAEQILGARSEAYQPAKQTAILIP